jgi:hypothetical protein
MFLAIPHSYKPHLHKVWHSVAMSDRSCRVLPVEALHFCWNVASRSKDTRTEIHMRNHVRVVLDTSAVLCAKRLLNKQGCLSCIATGLYLPES